MTEASTAVVVYGGGGFAREVAWLVSTTRGTPGAQHVACFVDDAPGAAGRSLNGMPVMSLADAAARHRGARIVIAVGSPSLREQLAARAAAAGFSAAVVVHPRTEMSEWVTMGEGTVICAGCILTTNITLGRHVQINLDCTVGHDVVMADFATLAPGVHVSGWVTLEAGVYVGTGAAIINGREGEPLVVGRGAVIGAGAVVTKPVPPGTTVVGVPARPR